MNILKELEKEIKEAKDWGDKLIIAIAKCNYDKAATLMNKQFNECFSGQYVLAMEAKNKGYEKFINSLKRRNKVLSKRQ